MIYQFVAAVTLFLAVTHVTAIELTFDIEATDVQCFYDDYPANLEIDFSYQVIYGGRVDIDMEIKIDDEVIKSDQKLESNYYNFVTKKEGQYSFCFRNEFATVDDKTVYFEVSTEWDDEEFERVQRKKQKGALTMTESSAASIHSSLKTVTAIQTYMRNHEATHRKTAEFINGRVNLISAISVFVIVAASVGQVFYLRRLFEDTPK